MVCVDNFYGCSLDCRMATKIRADESSISGPFVLRIRGRVNADESSSVSNELLECRLFRRTKYIACCIQEHHDSISGQVLVGKHPGVRRCDDIKTVLNSQRLQGLNARGNRVVVKACG